MIEKIQRGVVNNFDIESPSLAYTVKQDYPLFINIRGSILFPNVGRMADLESLMQNISALEDLKSYGDAESYLYIDFFGDIYNGSDKFLKALNIPNINIYNVSCFRSLMDEMDNIMEIESYEYVETKRLDMNSLLMIASICNKNIQLAYEILNNKYDLVKDAMTNAYIEMGNTLRSTEVANRMGKPDKIFLKDRMLCYRTRYGTTYFCMDGINLDTENI
jgi:hypothetical protein